MLDFSASGKEEITKINKKVTEKPGKNQLATYFITNPIGSILFLVMFILILELTCVFGSKTLQLGEGFEKGFQYYDSQKKARCECTLPPFLTCKEI